VTENGKGGARPVGLGLTGFASAPAADTVAELSDVERAALERAAELMTGRRLVLLTGAGLSTDSGIPDYRGPTSVPRSPMTYQQFVGNDQLRQRYWARNHLGWHRLRHADPNAGHFAVRDLERAGLTTGIITQNVDRLHEDAGARNVIDLHGRYDQVICLSCRTVVSRAHLATVLEELNPGFLELVEAAGPVETAPDADAAVEQEELIARFRMADCEICDGMLKPDFVFFGENVPKDRVADAYAMVDAAEVLLAAGTSLTVMSGLRFPRHAAKNGKPVVIINRGVTRGDDTATVKVEAGVSEGLAYLAGVLPAAEPGGLGNKETPDTQG
jgi:NAD-dependent SIR2 family protein deacetylase